MVSVVFHPSGRAFFTAHQGGEIYLWRILRTERQIGLRDENAASDQARVGRQVVTVGQLDAQVEDMWLGPLGATLYVASLDGGVYRWKVRGVKRRTPIKVGAAAVLSARGFNLSRKGGRKEFLVASGRAQRLLFWCAEPDFRSQESDDSLGSALVVSTAPVKSNISDYDAELAALFGDEESNDAQVDDEEQEKENVIPLGFVARSPLFSYTLDMVRMGKTQPLLWAAEKTGKLLFFDASRLLNSRPIRARARFCL